MEKEKISYILTLKDNDLSNCILDLNKKDKENILTNNEIRQHLIKPSNHSSFVKIIKSLNENELLNFLDSNMIDKILLSDHWALKLRTILECNNDNLNKILCNERVLEAIIKNNLVSNLNNLNQEFGQYFFNYLIKKEPNNLSYLKYLSPDVQTKLFLNKKNIENLKKIEDTKFLEYLSASSINILLKEEKYIIIFLNLSISKIDRIIKKGLILPNYLQNSDILINKYLNTKDINIYRLYINNLNLNNNHLCELIEKKRNKYYDNLITRVNDINKYDELEKSDYENYKLKYEDLNEEEIRINYINKKKLEILVDKYFKDITYNFFNNTIQMLDFVSSIKEKLIDKEILDIYKNIINLNNLSIKQTNDLYIKLSKYNNLEEIYYDNYTKCRNHMINLINNKLINLNNIPCSKKLKEKYNVDIFELNGMDFYAILNHTSIPSNQVRDKYISSQYETTSLSLISNNHINIFKNDESNIIFGFNNLNSDRIMHVNNTDSGTNHSYGTDMINKLYSPEDLINKTRNYNEILYQGIDIPKTYTNQNIKNLNYTVLKPDYIMCYDKIDIGDIDCAKKLNIPILLLHTKYYKNNGLELNDYEKHYMNNEYNFIKLDGYKK